MFCIRTISSALLIAVAGCSTVSTVDSILEPVSDAASLDIALTQLVEAGIAPGLTLAVVKGGTLVYLKGFGDADASQATRVTAESGFNLWSVSKVFTQLAVLSLVEDGLAQLDDPICKHIEWLDSRECKADAGAITTRTIRTLLNHTAGVPDLGLKLYGETQFETDEVPTQKVIAKRLTDPSERWSQPSNESRYSNTHYLLLAAIVEHISNQTFAEYVQTHVLQPLGLKNTGYRYPAGLPIMSGSHPADITSFFAFFYVDKARAVQTKKEGRYWFNNVYNSSLGSTGLVSNGPDIAKFMTTMLTCLRAMEGVIPLQSCQEIIKAARIEVTKSPARGVEGLGQKLGWFVLPTELGDSFAHGGSGMGYTAMLQLFPDKELGIFVVANDSYFDRNGGLAITTAVSKIVW